MTENLASLITKESVEAALPKLKRDQEQLQPSTKYLVSVEGIQFPPKEVVRYAAHELGLNPDNYRLVGGPPTNKHLKSLGYKITSLANTKPNVTIDTQFKNYWRIGSSEGATGDSRWDEMFKNRIVSVGWNEIGDLIDQKISSRDEIMQLMEPIKYYTNKSTLSRKAGEIFDFFVNIKPNDIVVIQDGRKILGIGEVTGGYQFNPELNFKHTREVNWLTYNKNFPSQPEGNMTTVHRLNEKSMSLIESILNNNSNDNHMEENQQSYLNTILYGPPGTGKTYHTINKAISIIENKPDENLLNEKRADLKKRYDEYLKSGQIVFTTFHQSLSYEDFIEGIKPVIPRDEDETSAQDQNLETGAISYNIKPGMFKKLCSKAKTQIKPVIDYDKLWEGFVNSLLNIEEEVIFKSTESEMRLEKETSTVDSLKIRFVKSYDPTEEQGKRIFPVSKESIRKIFDEGVDVSPGARHQWINVRDVIGAGRATLCLGVYKKFWEYADSKGAFTKEETKDQPYVLIIDEINRGNVSQIFGELITLIEESKREGASEALEVTLPYSNEKFSVPANLHIIGTMNTADRSVEALDVALRRRFKFEYKGPEYTLKELQHQVDELGVKLSDLLKVINDRITFLKDEDHQIGHSYLMDKSTPELLSETFNMNIIPLLKEYFYNDHGKIRLVLGDGFVSKDESHKPDFASDDEVLETTVYALKPINKKNILEALRVTIGKK